MQNNNKHHGRISYLTCHSSDRLCVVLDMYDLRSMQLILVLLI
jgi:hypothetical protein